MLSVDNRESYPTSDLTSFHFRHNPISVLSSQQISIFCFPYITCTRRVGGCKLGRKERGFEDKCAGPRSISSIPLGSSITSSYSVLCPLLRLYFTISVVFWFTAVSLPLLPHFTVSDISGKEAEGGIGDSTWHDKTTDWLTDLPKEPFLSFWRQRFSWSSTPPPPRCC